MDELLTKHLVPILGCWHIVKLAAEAVWKTFLPSFIAPLFHSIYPTKKVPYKPTLFQIFSFFNTFMLAYKDISTDLYSALEQPDLALKGCLYDLLFLMDYAIPLVSKFIYYLLGLNFYFTNSELYL